MVFCFSYPALEFFLKYLLFKSLPLFLGEDTDVALLSYFHSLICYLDHWALRASATQTYNLHVFPSFSLKFRAVIGPTHNAYECSSSTVILLFSMIFGGTIVLTPVHSFSLNSLQFPVRGHYVAQVSQLVAEHAPQGELPPTGLDTPSVPLEKQAKGENTRLALL